MKTRPTSDRLRETLFNVLAPRIEGARFVDLYAGSGAVGIEALSRGARYVWFAENAAAAMKAIRTNLATLRIGEGFAIESRGALPQLEELAANNTSVDLIFLDPPYDAAREYARVLEFLGSERGELVLAEDARVIAEHSNKAEMPERVGRLVRVRVLKQGDAALSFYAVEPDA
jgi:16S rRNA (guanine(966)-N(2))-methyltransferase RsmD